MIDSIINYSKTKDADCLILSAKYDRTSSLGQGAKNGADGIIKCLREDIEFLDRYTMKETGYDFKIANIDIGVSNKDLPEKMVSKVSQKYLKLISDKRLLFLLGGDHSVSTGALQAISKKYNSRDVTIFQIDAHCDLRNDDSNANPYADKPSRFAHSCVMRRAHEMGFNIVQVGVRSYSREEYDFFIKNKKIKVFEWGKKKAPSINQIINSIKTKNVYISVDADGIDPAHLPSTGTPVPGGLEWYFTINLLNELIRQKIVLGMDLVEVIPRKNENLTTFGAAQLCYHMISMHLQKIR